MRSPVLMLFVAMSGFVWSACADDKNETRVWGTMRTDVSDTFEVTGQTLANDGAERYGYCKFENNAFSFAISTHAKAQLGGTNARSFEIVGIAGAPSANPYDSTGKPRADENRTFKGGTIWAETGNWSISASDIIADRCKVSLFAEAGEGDLTPVKYGKDPFQYLLKIDCANGLNQVPNTNPSGIELGSIQVELWFDNCT